MPPSKVPNSVAKLVLELADQQKEAAEIAQILNLKKVQVSTLLAYHKQIETKTHEAAEPTVEVELPEPVGEVEIEVEPPKKVAVEAKETTPEEEEEEETTKDHGVYVGDDADYGDAIYWNPQDAGAAMNPHLMIMGESAGAWFRALRP